MFFIRRFARQLGADDGDDGGGGIGEVVYRVQHDGDGVGQQPHGGLETRQKQVGGNADDAGSYDHLVP